MPPRKPKPSASRAWWDAHLPPGDHPMWKVTIAVVGMTGLGVIAIHGGPDHASDAVGMGSLSGAVGFFLRSLVK